MNRRPAIGVMGLGIMGAAMAQGLALCDTASVCGVLRMIAGVDGPRVKRR